MKKKSSFSQSILKRATKLAGTTASIAAKEVSLFIKNRSATSEIAAALDTRISQAQELVSTLSELKGAAMKAGQWLSIEFSDLLPPEITQILRQLHDQSTPMEFEEIKAILKHEWEHESFKELNDLSRQPIAAASIGQVHRARYQNRDVAIKIQFPKVAQSIGSDLFLLKNLCKTYLRVAGKDIPLDEIFDELKDVLSREVNYQTEAQFVGLYREGLKNDPRYVVPTVFPQLSTKSVLTLTFEEGMRVDEWLRSKRSTEETSWVGRGLIDLVLKEFFEVGLVQSDPNYGNFLIRPHTKQIVLLDLGASRIYEVATRKKVLRILQTALRSSPPEILQCAYDEGLLDPRENDRTKQLLVELMTVIVQIMAPERQPFSFADPSFLATVRNLSLEFTREVKYTAPAKDLLLLNRKLGGIFHLLKDAVCSLNLHQIWNDLAIEKLVFNEHPVLVP